MTIVKNQPEIALIIGLFEKDPLATLVIEKNGQLVWLNGLAQTFLGTTVTQNTKMMSHPKWRTFQELLQENTPFHYLLGEQGFIVISQNYGAQHQYWLIRLVPSETMELDLIEMQRGLTQQRKLANLGKLMLEMAHELNNPLTSISMGSQLIELSLENLKTLLPESHEPHHAVAKTVRQIHDACEKINLSAQRAVGLRQEVLAYSKPYELDFKPYEVRSIIQTALENIQHQPFFKHVTIEMEFSEQPSTIMCDVIKLEQIFYNLLRNAHEAMQGSGKIWIREFCNVHHVLIEIEDTGPGIPPDLMGRIFSPFLTTKPRTGNGLGLSISQQIIHKHGGTFSVYNKPMSGGVFSD